MKRFAGLMPVENIEATRRYHVGEAGKVVVVDAGPQGWTIIHSDGSTQYKDVEGTTEENMQRAVTVLENNYEVVYLAESQELRKERRADAPAAEVVSERA